MGKEQADKLDLPPEQFPRASPFTLDQALADGFVPEAAEGER